MKRNDFINRYKEDQSQAAAFTDVIFGQRESQLAHGIISESGISIALIRIVGKKADRLFNAFFAFGKFTGYLFEAGVK